MVNINDVKTEHQIDSMMISLNAVSGAQPTTTGASFTLNQEIPVLVLKPSSDFTDNIEVTLRFPNGTALWIQAFQAGLPGNIHVVNPPLGKWSVSVDYWHVATAHSITLNLFAEPTEPLNSITLSGYDVLVIGNNNLELTPQEEMCVEQYVRNGGGLLLTGMPEGYAGVAYSGVGSLSEKFGTLFSREKYLEEIKDIHVTHFASHLISSGLHDLVMESHTSALQISEKSTGIAFLDDGEPVIAASEYYRGKVVIVGNSRLWFNYAGFDYFGQGDNARLADNLFNWLSQPSLDGQQTASSSNPMTILKTSTAIVERNYDSLTLAASLATIIGAAATIIGVCLQVRKSKTKSEARKGLLNSPIA